MSNDPSSRPQTIWRRAWPAWLLLGATLLIWLVSAVGAAPWLQQYRISDTAEFGGGALLVVFGLPLLIAWGLWSAFSLRHWAARLGVYAALLLVGFWPAAHGSC